MSVGGRKKSLLWDHFDVVQHPTSLTKKQAKCTFCENVCSSNTQRMRNHLIACKKAPQDVKSLENFIQRSKDFGKFAEIGFKLVSIHGSNSPLERSFSETDSYKV